MRTFTRPVRFLAIVVALWIGGRIWWLLPPEIRDGALRPTAGRAAIPPATGMRAPIPDRVARAPVPSPRTNRLAATSDRHRSPTMTDAILPPELAFAITARTGHRGAPMERDDPVPALPAAVPIGATSTSRWSGDAYLFVRNGTGNALAAGGQLGGGQAGARIAWRLNRDGPARIALAARAYAPLDDRKGTEAAVGVDFHPLPGRPLRLSVERRFDVGGRGRNAWSAYAAGGFWREIGPGVELDGYAQAGIVGARAGDLFGDGALRLARRWDLGEDKAVRLGGGAWTGAQPGVARLDMGPRVAIGLPLGRANVSAAVEGRFRIAGDAAPGSGVALTLATDF